jgi:hypothetical protein
MPIQPELRASHTRERSAYGDAFGLRLDVDPRIDIPGVTHAQPTATAEADSAALGAPVDPPTRVRVDPVALEQRWSAARAATTVRELRDGATLLLSVEHAPSLGYLLHAPGFARILVADDGIELICAPEPGSAAWPMLLPAQALPLAATLRGLEVLHAAGVVLNERAVMLAGEPGAGKSSLAAALLRRGAGLLSDDAVALALDERSIVAHPGAALVLLRAAERDRLSARELAELGPNTRSLDKCQFVPPRARPARFGALFLLERSDRQPALERMDPVDPFALLASTYNLSVRTAERLARHLDLAATLADSGQVFHLRVQSAMNASELAEIVLEHMVVSA